MTSPTVPGPTSTGPTSEFDRHVHTEPDGAGGYRAHLDPGWVVGGGVNGGYLSAVVGHALGQAVPGKPHVLSLSSHFVSASVPGPAAVRVDVHRDGGRTAVVGLTLEQDGVPRLHGLATLADLHELSDDVETTAQAPVVPPREQCVAAGDAPPEVLAAAPMLQRSHLLFPPGEVGWALGAPSGVARHGGWFRLIDDREPDPLVLLMVLDCLPPVTFQLGRIGWAPTLSLSSHVRALPAPGWLVVVQESRNLAGGYFEEDCEVWDSTGRLVAQARQLAGQPR